MLDSCASATWIPCIQEALPRENTFLMRFRQLTSSARPRKVEERVSYHHGFAQYAAVCGIDADQAYYPLSGR
jgi:hypothetical protein